MHRRKGSGKTGKRNESGVWAFGAVKGIVWNIRKCKGQQSRILGIQGAFKQKKYKLGCQLMIFGLF